MDGACLEGIRHPVCSFCRGPLAAGPCGRGGQASQHGHQRGPDQRFGGLLPDLRGQEAGLFRAAWPASGRHPAVGDRGQARGGAAVGQHRRGRRQRNGSAQPVPCQQRHAHDRAAGEHLLRGYHRGAFVRGRGAHRAAVRQDSGPEGQENWRDRPRKRHPGAGRLSAGVARHEVVHGCHAGVAGLEHDRRPGGAQDQAG
ncbi:hypothetical protein CDEF62S_03010 [Castellaniella defragrans]